MTGRRARPPGRNLDADLPGRGLELSAITALVSLWHGLADNRCPPSHGRWLAEQIPRVAAHFPAKGERPQAGGIAARRAGGPPGAHGRARPGTAPLRIAVPPAGPSVL